MDESTGAPELDPPDPAQVGRIRDASSGMSCPECDGSLWEEDSGELVQYRCRVGHVYSVDSLFSNKSVAVEAALWRALNAL